MKKFFIYCTMISIVFIICSEQIHAGSIHTPFVYENIIGMYDKDQIIRNIGIISTDKEYRGPNSICSYDVNSVNQIAIGFNSIIIQNQRINIYDSNGTFQYGFKFSHNGIYLLEYDLLDNRLMIYLSHSNLLVKIDENGHVIDLVKVKINRANLSYTKELRHLTSINRNENLYIRHSLLPDSITKGYTSSYTSIYLQTPDLNTHVVYDNTLYHWAIILIGIQLVIILMTGFVLVAIYVYKILTAKVMLKAEIVDRNSTCPASDMNQDGQTGSTVNTQNKPNQTCQTAVSLLNIISGGFFISTICGVWALKSIINSRFEPDYINRSNRMHKAVLLNHIGIVFIGIELVVVVIVILHMTGS